jgi:hypothetical protein
MKGFHPILLLRDFSIGFTVFIFAIFSQSNLIAQRTDASFITHITDTSVLSNVQLRIVQLAIDSIDLQEEKKYTRNKKYRIERKRKMYEIKY